MAHQIKVKEAQGEDVRVQEFLDMIAPSIIKFHRPFHLRQYLSMCMGTVSIPDLFVIDDENSSKVV